ncbi:putative Secreted protein [Paraburkholderia kururiensis]
MACPRRAGRRVAILRRANGLLRRRCSSLGFAATPLADMGFDVGGGYSVLRHELTDFVENNYRLLCNQFLCLYLQFGDSCLDAFERGH